MDKKQKCYIYTRVSTDIQVDNYSLDAQKERLKAYALYKEMEIVGEYCDEGKSGKSIEGRTEFKKMMDDITNEKDNIDYVLVFKLSRFGRNTADVLNSLEIIQEYNVNLYCIEEGIDSGNGTGKLILTILAAVAEMERENIAVQTMEGRKQKARQGEWNGGQAPIGYKLENHNLIINEEEAKIVRLTFDKFVNTTMGANGVAKYLNSNGIRKKKYKNSILNLFSAHHIKLILDNEVYCGKIAYGKRKTEKVKGTTKKIYQEKYMLCEGKHEAIVSEELWQKAQEKRKRTGNRYEKTYNLEREHLLSGILKCPVCGSPLYGNISHKKDGKIYYYYMCKHKRTESGHKCTYKKQLREEKINEAVIEVIKNLVNNPKFAEAIKLKIGSKIDTAKIDEEILIYNEQLRKYSIKAKKIDAKINDLDVDDECYDEDYDFHYLKLKTLRKEIKDLKGLINTAEMKKYNLKKEKVDIDNIYKYLLYFERFYNKFNDREKKKFFNSFIDRIEIYEEEQTNGQLLKQIKFKFPVFFDGQESTDLSLDNNTHVETIICLSKKK